MQSAAERIFLEEATEEALVATPAGNANHRIYVCPRLKASRCKHAGAEDIARGMANPGTLDFERAMAQRPPKAEVQPSEEGTFTWHIAPIGGWLEGTVYPDGSLLDGRFKELGRCGWAFTVIRNDGRLMASASGVPPSWITDIGGAEAWALYQAARFATPGACKYVSDSLTTVQALQAGIGYCGSGKKKYARVYKLGCEALAGTPAHDIAWMPAHKSRSFVGCSRLSNGLLLTEIDRDANDRSDKLAKSAVEIHRVEAGLVDEWSKAFDTAKARAKWIARATHEANNQEMFPFQDSEAARWRSDAAAAERRKAKHLRSKQLVIMEKLKVMKEQLSPEQGGHTLVQIARQGKRSGWRCQICKARSSSRTTLACQMCKGDPTIEWASRAANPEVPPYFAAPPLAQSTSEATGKRTRLDIMVDGGQLVSRPHDPVWSEDTLWCTVCGAYAETKVMRLGGECKGRPKRGSNYGGAWGSSGS